MEPLSFTFPVIKEAYDLNRAAKTMHWGTRAAYNRKIHKLVRDTLDSEGIVPPEKPIELAVVVYHFELATRHRRDPENLAGVGKPYMDALVEAGFMLDDSWQNIYPLVVAADPVPGSRKLNIIIIPTTIRRLLYGYDAKV